MNSHNFQQHHQNPYNFDNNYEIKTIKQHKHNTKPLIKV